MSDYTRLQGRFIDQDFQFSDSRTYLLTALIIGASVLVPYAMHQVNLAGQVFLPLYFIILIASYTFGWKVGLMTAVASPMMSWALTGLPPSAILPFVVLKGSLLALIASAFADSSQKLSLVSIAAAIFLYQLIGDIFIFLVTQNSMLAFADVRIGYPGLLLHVFGGYLVLYWLRQYGEEKLG